MTHLARRVLSTAAAVGALGLALTGCGMSGSGSASGSGSGSDTSSQSLDCSDLKKQVDKNAPNATASFSEFDPQKLLALAAWAAENGKNFEDAELGRMVAEWGEQTPKVEEFDDAVEKNDNAALDKLAAEGVDNAAIDKYEANSDKINAKCPDIGFGIIPN